MSVFEQWHPLPAVQMPFGQKERLNAVVWPFMTPYFRPLRAMTLSQPM